MERVSEAGRTDAYQLCCNLLWRHPERDVIPWCREHGVVVVTFSSIAQGLLSDTPRSPSSFVNKRRTGEDPLLPLRRVAGPGGLRGGDAGSGGEARHAAFDSHAALGAREAGRRLVPGRRALPGADRAERGGRPGAPNPREIDDELTRLSSEAMRHIPDEGNIFLFHP